MASNLPNDNGIHPDVTERFEYTWAIDNFTSFHGMVDKILESPEFPNCEREDEIKWKLLLYPKGSFANQQDYISLYLYLVSCKSSQVEIINCKLSIANFTLEFGEPINIFDTLGFNHFISWNHLTRKENNFLPNNQLTIFCEIAIRASSQSGNIPYNISIPESTLSRDFEQLYNSQKFCDVLLLINDTKFKAHKAILSIRSPVFRDYFDLKKKSPIDIGAIDAPTFREILRFIYTGEVTNLTTSVENLLAAANTFQLERLKFMCGREISKTLTEENVYTILELANRHNAEDLKSQVNNFISQHSASCLNYQNGNC